MSGTSARSATATEGWYFDGKTSRKHRVSYQIAGGVLQLQGDVVRENGLHQLNISERTRNGPRKVYFPDGAHLEVSDGAVLHAMLQAAGHVDSEVVQMQQSWRAAALALCGTLLVLVLGYVYGLPAAAKLIARALPPSVERTLGKESMAFMDKAFMTPSQLSAPKKQALVQRFKLLAARQAGAPPYEIVFRKSKIGPNAFALPSGQIVLTDDIIELVGNDDDAIMGILAHELGHLHQRHTTRRIIQSSIIAAVGATLFGDVSSVVAGIPALLGDLKYSRDAETEADDYAIDLFKANGLKLEALAGVFEKLGAKTATRGGEPPGYLSTHPPSAERVARIRRAQAGN
jgi:Zn-dependent protease with chaperone function